MPSCGEKKKTMFKQFPDMKTIRNYFRRRRYMRKNRTTPMWGGGFLSDNIEKALDTFLNEEEKKSSRRLRMLRNDMRDSYIDYGVIPMEYFLMGFEGLDHNARSRFLCNQHKDRLMIGKIGMDTYNKELRDKYAFYLRYSDLFKRDVCKIESQEDKVAFVSLCSKHSKVIVKPLNGMCGTGCRIIGTEDAEDIFDGLLAEGKWIIEELICQNEDMAQWNSSSVNTVRIPSFYNSKGFHIFRPFFRTGRKGAVVDNAAQGGLFAMIDEQTGVLRTDGMTEYGKTFEKHPESGLTYKGWQIPAWDDLLKTAQKAHERLKHHPYIGWDFAYTDKGWVLIEGDWGQFLNEFSDKIGIRNEFEMLIEA